MASGETGCSGFAIRWLKAGGSIYDLQQHLGHTSVKTTEGYLGFLTATERAIAQTGAQSAFVEGAGAPAQLGLSD